MTGPAYPRPSRLNGIGQFTIGVSPIGTIPYFDPWTTIIAQYANSPRVTALIESFNEAMDLTEPLDSFYDLVWNVLTCNTYGLNIWGQIVNVKRTLRLPGAVTYFGFNEPGADWTGFDQGGFYTGGGLTENYILQDSDYRTLILAKAAGNISDGSIPAVNQILLTIFPNRGACYVVDGLDMSLTYTFEFALTPAEVAIVSQLDVLPNAAGVSINISQLG